MLKAKDIVTAETGYISVPFQGLNLLVSMQVLPLSSLGVTENCLPEKIFSDIQIVLL